MVARDDELAAQQRGQQARELERLRRLVDHDDVEAAHGLRVAAAAAAAAAAARVGQAELQARDGVAQVAARGGNNALDECGRAGRRALRLGHALQHLADACRGHLWQLDNSRRRVLDNLAREEAHERRQVGRVARLLALGHDKHGRRARLVRLQEGQQALGRLGAPASLVGVGAGARPRHVLEQQHLTSGRREVGGGRRGGEGGGRGGGGGGYSAAHAEELEAAVQARLAQKAAEVLQARQRARAGAGSVAEVGAPSVARHLREVGGLDGGADVLHIVVVVAVATATAAAAAG